MIMLIIYFNGLIYQVYVMIDRKNGGEGSLYPSPPFFRTFHPFPGMQGGKGGMGDG
jgi:hypothetical protein